MCGLMLVPMFTATGLVVKLFHEKQARIAEDWRAAGNANLTAGHAKEAIEDFRNALLYAPDSSLLQLELSRALIEQGKIDEAKYYLLNLRAANPQDAPAILELARIAVRQGNVDDAASLYHDAMYGHWPGSPNENRRAARSELIEYFLQNGRKDSARSEALAMAVENPGDPDARIAAGEFLLRADDPRNALTEFDRALRLEPRSGAARAGREKAKALIDERERAAETSNEFSRPSQPSSTDDHRKPN